MPRRARKAPLREPQPLDEYSTWDIRYAKFIYYAIIIGAVITILGIWLTIIAWLIGTGKWQAIANQGIGVVALIIVGIVVIHLFLLVLFYILFRGGIVRLCQKMFKDRILAKKYEDYTSLRLLVAVALISVYIFVLTLIIVIIPSFVWNWMQDLWKLIEPFLINNFGLWILLIGIIFLIIIGIIYLGFVIWNHAVFAVLKRVKRIEEEIEIDQEIEKDELKKADEATLQRVYQKTTGKKPVYRGKETKGYKAWKKKMLS
ncbi:MAG: hypothetical protein ACFFBI_10780 [Promethearchaeota archaeon]